VSWQSRSRLRKAIRACASRSERMPSSTDPRSASSVAARSHTSAASFNPRCGRSRMTPRRHEQARRQIRISTSERSSLECTG
jgi:hypothetical protein